MKFGHISKALGAIALYSSVVGCSGGGSGGSSTPTPAFPVTVGIVLSQAFTDTNIAVTAGETLTITASGMMNHADEDSTCAGGSCETSPAGLPVSNCANLPNFTAPTLPCWSLIGKIGQSGVPFEVGTNLTVTAPGAGELFLGVNDNDYADNSGAWTAIINN